MPLYTYIATYRGASYAGQNRFSNFKGFASRVIGDVPDGVLPGLDKAMRNDVIEAMWRGQWQPIANRKNVWRNSFEVRGSEFVLYAVQTDE